MGFMVLGFAAAGAQQETKAGSMSKDQGTMKKDDAMMKKDDLARDFFDLAGLGPSVAYFTTEDEAMSMAKNARVVYFFAAGWCPNCRAAYQDIKTNFKAIPMDIKILFVNYDKAKDLKMKFGVTYQHTFVLLDGMGKPAKTWSGSATVAELVKAATAR